MCRKRKLLSDVLGLTVLIFICLYVVFSRKVASFALDGMKLCAYQLIPSVFPILVLNSLLVKSGFASKLAAVIGGSVSSLFGVNKHCALPLVTGVLCGAPSGAAITATLEKEGVISKDDALVALIMSSSVSAGFIVGAVGGGLLFSIERGIAIWLFEVISCFTVSMLFSKRETKELKGVPQSSSSLSPSILGSSINEALSNMLIICGTVIFFSSLSGIAAVIPFLPDTVKTFLSAALEITSGCAVIASKFTSDTAFVLLCAATGWSGVSMITQTLSLCDGRISAIKFILAKALCSALCALLGILSIAIKII